VPDSDLNKTTTHIILKKEIMEAPDFDYVRNYSGHAEWEAKTPINYAFQENKFLFELQQYIDSTYTAHYGDSKYQATDMIIDAGHGTGFNIGNIMKYAKRYGKKKGYNRADLLKIIHYAIMQLHVHEIEHLEGTNEV
jgi:hypothetical protein